MRIPIALTAAALLAIAAAACSGGQQSNYIAPPSAGVAAPATGLVTLGQTSTSESVGTANGVTGVLTFGTGTGTVTSLSSATVPNGLVAVTTSAQARIILADTTNPSVFYVTILSPTGATLSGLPGISLSLSTPATSTYQEAQWNGTKFATVPGSTVVMNAAKTALTFPATKTPVTIAPTGSIYLAFYQNGVPPPSGPNVLADSGFESGIAAPLGSPVTATGWTVCTITGAASGVTFPSGRPLSNFTPVPAPNGSPPAAFIEAAGTTVPQGTKTPAPTVTAVPVNTGSHAAVFGEVFNNFQAADFAYNGLCQALKMPSEPSASLSVLANGTENDKTFFALQVDVLDANGKFLANLADENQIQTSPPGDTAYRTINIPQSALSAYSGQNVQLFVGMWTKAGSSSNSPVFSGYYFVDDVMLFGIQ